MEFAISWWTSQTHHQKFSKTKSVCEWNWSNLGCRSLRNASIFKVQPWGQVSSHSDWRVFKIWLDASAKRQNWKICRRRVQGDFYKIKAKTRKALDRQRPRVLQQTWRSWVQSFTQLRMQRNRRCWNVGTERWKKKCSSISQQTIPTNILMFLTNLLRDTTTQDIHK